MKKLILPFVAGLALLLAGCASGPKFSESGDAAATPPPGQSLVFILRTPNFAGSVISWDVGLNGRHLVTVPNGGYHLFTNAPGTMRFTVNQGSEILRLEARADTTHYLKFAFGQMEELPPAKGKEALSHCNRIQP